MRRRGDQWQMSQFPIHRLVAWIAALSVLTSLSGQDSRDVDLVAKYRRGPRINVLTGTPELFRMNATYAPLPAFPDTASAKGGLVMIQVAVSPDGRVVDHRIMESFDPRASEAVVAAVKSWRFRTADEMMAARLIVVKEQAAALRINRLGFDFRVENGKRHVVDLVQQEVKRRNLPDPFLGKRNGR